MRMRPSCAHNPHTLELDPYRHRRRYCRLREPPGAGASDDTGQICGSNCRHATTTTGEGRVAPPGSVEVTPGIDAVLDACESDACPVDFFFLAANPRLMLSFSARWHRDNVQSPPTYMNWCCSSAVVFATISSENPFALHYFSPDRLRKQSVSALL